MTQPEEKITYCASCAQMVDTYADGEVVRFVRHLTGAGNRCPRSNRRE